MSRTISRENAFRTIYSKLFNNEFDGFEASDDINKKCNLEYYNLICDNFSTHKDEIKELISNSLKGITIDRVYKIDLALIYLALIEINYLNTPCKVVLNEIVELAKKYSTDKSAKFLNGFLANFVK